MMKKTYFSRKIINNIQKQFAYPEVILIYGARRTGKSTLLEILNEHNSKMKIFDCENPVVAETLQSKNTEQIKLLFGDAAIIALDEAQVIPNIGQILKLIFDNKTFNPKIIATGSSSFDLANTTGEPLTGRNVSFKLYPLSASEIIDKEGWIAYKERLNEFMIYGTYPGIMNLPENEKRRRLLHLSGDYLFKDIFKFEQIRNPELLRQLLKALALQLGGQVSVQELSKLLSTSTKTIERYIELLEKSFVIFKLQSFSGNLRNELRKSRKYYFYDNGIRNAIINNFSSASGRTDMGGLWENYCIAEYLKKISYDDRFSNLYFWRTYDGAEIDLVEEVNGEIIVFEFKWSIKRKVVIPKSFSEKYKVDTLHVISPKNIHELIN